MSQRPWTPAQVRALGVTTDVVTAGSILGIGRTKAYDLVRRGQFPAPVLTHGSRYIVPVSGLLDLLQVDTTNRSQRDGGIKDDVNASP